MIIEKGYYHPDKGYWQVALNVEIYGEDAPNLPEGTVEVPLKPSKLHQMVDGVWVPPTQEEIDADVAQIVREQRDIKLRTEVDPIVTNPLRWNSMNEEEQQLWANYRQALLDVPQQDEFPHNVNWPTKPE